MTSKLQQGGNTVLSVTQGRVVVSHDAGTGIDVNLTAFLTDANGQVRSDADMVFFNQPYGENGSVTFVPPTSGARIEHALTFDLSRLPSGISKVVVCLTEDGGAGFGAVRNLRASIQAGDEVVCDAPSLSGGNGIECLELYMHNGTTPKARATWNVYPAGLAGLATDHGVDVEEDTAPPPPPPAPTINLTKPAPVGAVNLSKGSKIDIAKPDEGQEIVATLAWQNKGSKVLDYDLFCHVTYRDGSSEIVKWDHLTSRTGAVRHHGDLKTGGHGTMERVSVRLTPDIACVGFSAYSALENGTGSFKHAKAQVSIDNGAGSQVTVGVGEMNASPFSYTMYFGTVINTSEVAMQVIGAQDFSRRGSEHQVVLYADGHHEMDRGPENYRK